MKAMFITYSNVNKVARTKELLECIEEIAEERILVSPHRLVHNEKTNTITSKKGYFKYIYFIIKAIKSIKSYKPNLIILKNNQTAFILRWLYKRKFRSIIIYDSAELYIDGKASNLKEKIAFQFRKIEKKYLKYADIVLAANVERANIMYRYYNLTERPIIFDNMHKIQESFDKVLCENKYADFFKNSFTITYSGGVYKQRLTLELAKAVGKLGNPYKLIIAGNADPIELNKLNGMVKKFKYKNIFYVGLIPIGELRYLLGNSHVSAAMYSQDTINNINCASGKVYEGLFEGTPIITSENPPLKRLCDDYNVGVSNNNFKFSLEKIFTNYNSYKKNVYLFLENIDYEKRKMILIETLKQEINNLSKHF